MIFDEAHDLVDAVNPLPIASLPPIGFRDSLGVVLAGNAVIFDEAHNLVDAVNGAHSCSVTLSQLRGAGRCAAGGEGRVIRGGRHTDSVGSPCKKCAGEQQGG